MLVILDHLFLVISKWVTHAIQIQVRVAHLFPSIGILLLTRIVFLFIWCLVSRFLRGNWVFLWSYDRVFQMFRRLIEQVVLLLSALLLVSQFVVPDSFNDHFEWGSLLRVKGLTQFGDYVYNNMGVFIISTVGFQGKHEAMIVVSVGTLNILFGERRPRRSCSRRNNRNLLNGLNLTSNMTLNPIIHFKKIYYQSVLPLLVGYLLKVLWQYSQVCDETLLKLQILSPELFILELVHHLFDLNVQLLLFFLLFVFLIFLNGLFWNWGFNRVGPPNILFVLCFFGCCLVILNGKVVLKHFIFQKIAVIGIAVIFRFWRYDDLIFYRFMRNTTTFFGPVG